MHKIYYAHTHIISIEKILINIIDMIRYKYLQLMIYNFNSN